MDLFLTQFHFVRPWWFVAIIPALLIAVSMHRLKNKEGQWYSHLPAHLAEILVVGGDQQQKSRRSLFVILAWLIGVTALAGPTWQKIELPLFKVKQAQVVILDMSLSMYATDIKPNRLTRARYKATDLLKQLGEGETGLVAFAGDAFVISPMTTDVSNLLNLLPSLNPSIMPALGSRPDLAVEKALELLRQAQYSNGQIYLIADDILASQSRAIKGLLANTNFNLNVLAVGTAKGAPITLPNDQLLKDDSGNIVIPSVPNASLASLASSLGGRYTPLTNNQSDIESLAKQRINEHQDKQATDNFGDRWHEFGPYLVLLLLPFVALSCRRGMLQSIAVMLVFASITLPNPALAAVATPTTNNSWWTDMWVTKDKQGHQAFVNQNHEQALAKFEDPKWRAATQYALGQYQEALDIYQQFNDADSLYNQGNALTQLGQYEEAIARYQQALPLTTDGAKVENNLAIAQQLLAQSKQQQQGNDEQQQQDQQNKEQQEQSDQEKQDGQQGQQQNQDQQQDQSANNQSEQAKQSDSNESQEQAGKQSQKDKGTNDSEEEKQALTPEQQKEQQAQQEKAAQLNETFNKDNLTKEQLAHLNQLVNKINDDPSLLLKNKMAVEARKRQRSRLAQKEAKNW